MTPLPPTHEPCSGRDVSRQEQCLLRPADATRQRGVSLQLTDFLASNEMGDDAPQKFSLSNRDKENLVIETGTRVDRDSSVPPRSRRLGAAVGTVSPDTTPHRHPTRPTDHLRVSVRNVGGARGRLVSQRGGTQTPKVTTRCSLPSLGTARRHAAGGNARGRQGLRSRASDS